jgi:hypothetical protein
LTDLDAAGGGHGRIHTIRDDAYGPIQGGGAIGVLFMTFLSHRGRALWLLPRSHGYKGLYLYRRPLPPHTKAHLIPLNQHRISSCSVWPVESGRIQRPKLTSRAATASTSTDWTGSWKMSSLLLPSYRRVSFLICLTFNTCHSHKNPSFTFSFLFFY